MSLVCRFFGHAWAYSDLVETPDDYGVFRESVTQTRRCARCGQGQYIAHFHSYEWIPEPHSKGGDSQMSATHGAIQQGVASAESPAWDRPIKDSRVHLLCIRCGNAAVVERMPYEPADAVRIEVNFCDICDEGGWFEETWYFKRGGVECSTDELDAAVQAALSDVPSQGS